MRVHQQIKETYEQIGDHEYNEINPYVHAVGFVRHKYPEAKIVKTKTVYDVLYGVQFPVLQVWFEL